MSIPKEPRQLMINLMYLVLTALLALNVSNEILNAFKVLAKGISDSNVAIDKRTIEVYQKIKANEQQPGQAEKVRPFREKADEVVKRSDDMIKYLESWKTRIIESAGGYNEEKEIDKPDNIDATTLLLVERAGGDTVRSRITELRQFLLNQISPQDSGAISPFLPLKVEPVKASEHNKKADWNLGYFNHMPVMAAIALFSKFENDVRSSEAVIVNRLFEEAHGKDIKFDTIAAVAVASTSYALEGQKIEASILLAAFNKSNKPTVTISAGGGTKKEAKNGVVPWETVAHGTGLQTVKGKIMLESEAGPISRDWKFEYMVGSTGASIQLDKMNVFYIGVENPVTVAAAGYSIEDVSINIPGATVTGEKGKYVVKVEKLGDVEVDINAKTKEGPVKKVGGMKVRVKRIPDPIAKLGPKFMGGAMNAALWRAQIAPAAILDNFDFDISFKIISFSITAVPKGKDLVGPYTTGVNRAGVRFDANANIKQLQDRSRAGDKIFIEEIKAVGPDGVVRNLNQIVLTLI